MKLEQHGYTFSTGTDTEVVLAAYAHWGESCVQHFNGMWAFAILDERYGQLFLSRDRFGIKPLYYHQRGTSFLFASEMKQLQAAGVSMRANRAILMDFVLYDYSDHSNATFIEGIEQVPQAHNLVYNLKSHTFRTERYYSLESGAITDATDDELVLAFHESFYRSVDLRLRSDVKVGTCLSGGTDSSSIAAAASNLRNRAGIARKMTAITTGCLDPESDETAFAKEVAEQAGLEWHAINPAASDFMAALEPAVHAQESPFSTPSILAQYLVFERAREIGCKVMLDGQGGDETLLGYERYAVSHVASGGIRGIGKRLHQSSLSTGRSPLRLLLYASAFLSPAMRYTWKRRASSFVTRPWANLAHHELIRDVSASFRNMDALQRSEITCMQLPHLLRYEDRNSMRHSVEARVPFLDHELVELALSIPLSLKQRDGWLKYVLRRAMERELPASVTWRKNKLGFHGPERALHQTMKELAQTELQRSPLLRQICRPNTRTEQLSSSSLWKLVTLAQWERLFDVAV